MATTFSNGLNYDVKHNPKIFAECLAKSYTLENENVAVIPDVKATSVKVNKFGTTKTGIVQADGRNCAWNANGTVSQGEKTITLKELKVNVEVCKEDLDELLSQEQYKAVKRGECPPEFEDILVDHLQNAIAQDNENLIWNGTTSDTLAYNGIVAQALSDSDVTDVTLTALSSASIQSNIASVIDALPQAVLDANEMAQKRDDEVKVFVNPTNFRYLVQALSASTSPTDVNVQMPSWTKTGDGKSLRIFYLGVEVVKAGIDANHIVAAQIGNLVVATDLMSDATLRAESGKDLKTENVLYVKCQYKIGVSYVYGSEIVLGTYTAPAQGGSNG